MIVLVALCENEASQHRYWFGATETTAGSQLTHFTPRPQPPSVCAYTEVERP